MKIARIDDYGIEQRIGELLRLGVMVAAAVVMAGGVLFLVRHHAVPPPYRVYRGYDAPFRTMRSILGSVLIRNSEGTIQFGILLLIATPVARVLFSVVAFALERDWMYVVFSALVLGILWFSLVHGSAL